MFPPSQSALKKPTLADALSRYLSEEVPKKKGKKRETMFIRKMMNYPMMQLPFEDVSASDWAKWRDLRLKHVKGSTVRRELTIIKALYRVAVYEWLWVAQSPLVGLRMPKIPPSRDRRITPEEEQKLLKVMGFKALLPPQNSRDYLALVFLFALETAMRSSEILNLKWEHIFLAQKYLIIADSKNGTKRHVPLSRKAIEILRVLPRGGVTCFQLSHHQRDVYFRKYRQQAGVLDLNFHDTRHEAITRLAQKLKIFDLSRMTGIKDLKTLMVYYNATATEIAEQLG